MCKLFALAFTMLVVVSCKQVADLENAPLHEISDTQIKTSLAKERADLNGKSFVEQNQYFEKLSARNKYLL